MQREPENLKTNDQRSLHSKAHGLKRFKVVLFVVGWLYLNACFRVCHGGGAATGRLCQLNSY